MDTCALIVGKSKELEEHSATPSCDLNATRGDENRRGRWLSGKQAVRPALT